MGVALDETLVEIHIAHPERQILLLGANSEQNGT
jgi:hypothetical protein